MAVSMNDKELTPEQKQFLEDIGINHIDDNLTKKKVATLMEIDRDYRDNYLALQDEAEHIARKMQRCSAVHSVRWRIKDSAHLIQKIIRKNSEGSVKYEDINVENYKSILTDLIGVRAIYLFKRDWDKVHDHILSKWELKEDEPVIIYHREGDDMEIYKSREDCKEKVHKHSYRSVHYIVPVTKMASQDIYCEIQTRTIFEEGWSEIDHAVRYPDFSDNATLKGYLSIFNRLAGSADEMGSFIHDIRGLIIENEEREGRRLLKEQEYIRVSQEKEMEISELIASNDKFSDLVLTYKEEIDRLNRELSQQKDSSLNSYVKVNLGSVGILDALKSIPTGLVKIGGITDNMDQELLDKIVTTKDERL